MAIDYKVGKKFRISGPSKYFALKYGNAYPVIEIEAELDFQSDFGPASFLYRGRVLAEGKGELLQGKTYYGHIEGANPGEFVHESELATLVTDIMPEDVVCKQCYRRFLQEIQETLLG